MSIPILATKLYRPEPREGLIVREQLLDRLNANMARKLTLISAPAGFGKTTLAVDWTTATGRPIAWLSLEEGDAAPARFLRYVIAALQTVDPNLGHKAVALLEAPQPPIDAALTMLINELAQQPAKTILVLDDYHLLDSVPVDELLLFLVDHLPGQVHLVITTREDPDLPLARLRVRGHVAEVRARDLRFTADEASRFLKETMGLRLSGAEIAILEQRTEGWIAGLQLAALSLQGQSSPHAFIEAFAGDHRYIVDYLVDEVLRGRSAEERRFLLETSILERLSGPLCAAVTEQAESSAVLSALERSNLFVIPMDNSRQWYRYHHLFADVLHTRLLEDPPLPVASLHARASRWFDENGFPADAIRHALAAGDDAVSARLIEEVWRTMDSRFQSQAWLEWAQQLPEEMIYNRPILCIGCAWAHLNGGRLEKADKWLDETAAWVDSDWIVTSHHRVRQIPRVAAATGELPALPANLAGARAYAALARGAMDEAVEYAYRALDLYPDSVQAQRGIPRGILGIACWADGDLATAQGYLEETLADFDGRADVPAALSVAYGLGELLTEQGKLTEAERIYQRALQRVAEYGDPILPGLAEIHAGLGELYALRGDTQAARTHLDRGEQLGPSAVLPGNEYRLLSMRARVEDGVGNPSAALALLDQAERLQIRTPMPDVRPAAATRARILLDQGETAVALAWAESRGLSPTDEPDYLQEYEQITLARILIARFGADGNRETLRTAGQLLARLLTAAEQGGRTRNMIDILVLQALAVDARGRKSDALAPLSRALDLAAPEGLVRPFTEHGAPLGELVRAVAPQVAAPGFAAQLLTAFPSGQDPVPSQQPLLDPLSDRELDVLRLLATDLTGPEIARELIVSLNTMRTHSKNIYAKLDVNSRRAAVHRAQELGLL